MIRSPRLAFAAALLAFAAFCSGCATSTPVPAGPPPEPVALTVGLFPIDGVAAEENDRVLSEMQATGLFDAVEQVRSKSKPGIDVYLTVVSNFGGLKSFDAMRPDVTAVSGRSRRTIRSWRAHCGGWDRFCLSGKLIARELAQALAPGGAAHADLMAEKSAAAPQQAAGAPSQQAAAAPAPASDIDRPPAARAEDPLRFALVIGIGAYKSLPEARYAARDAETVRDHLIALGYPRRNVILLTGDNATRTGIQKYLEEWLPRNVPDGGKVFFYYSGHGAPDTKTGEAYVVPWDGDPQFLQTTAYAVPQLYAALGKLKAKEVLVALDSCFSGAGGRSVLPGGARPLVTNVNIGMPSQGAMTVFAASSGEEIAGSFDEQGHGMFTYFFLKGLSGAARDGEGRVTARSLLGYLKPRVQDEARRQNREQSPMLLGSPDAEILKP